MAQATATNVNRPVWVDVTSANAAASRDFYSKLFGWRIDVNPDPQYGGYGRATIGDKDVAAVSPAQDPNAPAAWNVYIGTDDVGATASRVEAAGGKVIAPPFDVGDQGRMAVFQDPTGAAISAWQTTRMAGFQAQGRHAFSWAELNTRGIDRAIPFYKSVFGWTATSSPMGEGQPPYVQFQLDGENIAGGWEMSPTVPAGTPSYWQVYFDVDDVDAAFRTAIDLGGREMVAPQDFPGGRFAIVSDPQGASLGLLRQTPR